MKNKLWMVVLILACFGVVSYFFFDAGSLKGNVVALFVDTRTYNTLESEVQRYKNDIESDSEFEVKLFVDDYQNPDQIRSKLIEIKKDLAGSVLVGDIPIFYFEFDKPYSVIPSLDRMPSDRYYMDLDGEFPDENGNGAPDITKYEYYRETPNELYWSGRILPYNSGNQTELLKSYFERNHKYRIGELKPEKSLFVYSLNTSSGPSGDTYEIYEKNIKEFFAKLGMLYTEDQVNLLVDSSKEKFLVELDKPYESASINAHGHSSSQDIGTGISPVDIRGASPKPLFYYLLSCSNGDFSEPNYLGGHYLFDGNGLGVIAFTIPVFTGADNSKNYMEFLSQGDVLGDAYRRVQLRVNELQSVILGDPTLRVGYTKI